MGRMSDFAAVDGVIDAWVKATGSTLFTDWAGQPARFFHVPGKPPFECFQIVVFPPSQGNVAVQASSIDTNDDAEMMELWEGPVSTLDDMMATAVATVEKWKDREQGQDAGS